MKASRRSTKKKALKTNRKGVPIAERPESSKEGIETAADMGTETLAAVTDGKLKGEYRLSFFNFLTGGV
jgi:hypothetical protein